MKTAKSRSKKTSPARDLTKRTIEHEAIGAAAGAAAGAVAGVMAGPPGMVAGSIVGAAVGAAGAFALQQTDEEEEARTKSLDAAIGISGGDLGAECLEHPPAKVGAYSAAASGVSSTDGTPAEGPFQVPDDS